MTDGPSGGAHRRAKARPEPATHTGTDGRVLSRSIAEAAAEARASTYAGLSLGLQTEEIGEPEEDWRDPELDEGCDPIADHGPAAGFDDGIDADEAWIAEPFRSSADEAEHDGVQESGVREHPGRADILFFRRDDRVMFEAHVPLLGPGAGPYLRSLADRQETLEAIARVLVEDGCVAALADAPGLAIRQWAGTSLEMAERVGCPENRIAHLRNRALVRLKDQAVIGLGVFWSTGKDGAEDPVNRLVAELVAERPSIRNQEIARELVRLGFAEDGGDDQRLENLVRRRRKDLGLPAAPRGRPPKREAS